MINNKKMTMTNTLMETSTSNLTDEVVHNNLDIDNQTTLTTGNQIISIAYIKKLITNVISTFKNLEYKQAIEDVLDALETEENQLEGYYLVLLNTFDGLVQEVLVLEQKIKRTKAATDKLLLRIK